MLAQACLIPACGMVPVTTEAIDDDESRKRMTTTMLRGAPTAGDSPIQQTPASRTAQPVRSRLLLRVDNRSERQSAGHGRSGDKEMGSTSPDTGESRPSKARHRPRSARLALGDGTSAAAAPMVKAVAPKRACGPWNIPPWKQARGVGAELAPRRKRGPEAGLVIQPRA